MHENNKKMKELREQLGLSQSAFAKKFHMNVANVQKWEQGINKTPDHVAWMIETIIDYESRLNIN